MPYKLSDDGLSVMKEDGTLVKKHESKEKARAHLAALEANVTDAKSFFELLFANDDANTNSMKFGAMISSSNMKKVQAMHDFCKELGAKCEAEEATEEVETKSTITVTTVIDDKSLNASYAKSIKPDFPLDKLAVKYVGRNVIAHPVFIWGDKSITDLEAEFFTPESDFWDSVLKGYQPPLTWDHAQDEKFNEFEPDPVIGKTVKFYDDKIARWAESIIETDKKYRKYIDQFIEEKRLGYSSDTAPQYVVREPRGKATWLKQWPWFGGALTVSPCEPRMKTQYTPEFLKSIGVVVPDANSSNLRYAALKRQSEALKLKERTINR